MKTTEGAIREEIEHCKKMIKHLKSTDKTALLDRFKDRLAELISFLNE